jgi:hypothetical protein
MSLKIRCPHCQRVLLVEDEKAGRHTHCPACKQTITVPMPVRAAPSPVDVALHCPRCERAVAPGTSYCPHCATDLASGQRLPLGRRLRLVSLRTWAVSAVGLVVVGLLAFVCINVYRNVAEKSDRPPTRRAGPAHVPVASSAEAARRLLVAETSEERSAAVDALMRGGPEALSAVAAVLESSLGDAADARKRRNQRAALELLARSGDTRWRAVMEQCRRHEPLREDALFGLALLGDADVLEDLTAVWLRELRRRVFLASVARRAPGSIEGAAQAALSRAATRTERFSKALRHLRCDHDVRVLGRLGEAYWETWSWLGQSRDEAVALELFAIAKPAAATDSTGITEHIRAARDALERASQEGAPSARAAAGLVLAQCTPQYTSVRRRIIATLATILPECEPREQQRLTWTLAKLTGLTFGEVDADDEPADVGRDDVRALLKWARDSETATPGPCKTPSAAYSQRPILVRRVVTPQRQLERDLLRGFQGGWASADEALDRWLAAGLGCPPHVLERLDPAQRRPNHAALAAAMIIVAECNEQTARERLELWRQATDQPGWVREMAYMVLGCLDSRGGQWKSGWPAELNARVYAELDRGAPGWEHFGRILAAGGPAMRARLDGARPASLPREARARLLAAAERAARRQPREPRP